MNMREARISSLRKEHSLLRLFYSRVDPGKRIYREHQHTEFEISLIKAGEGTYTVGARKYSIEPGDIFLFSSNEIHYITDIKDNCEMVLMNVHFEPRFIWSPGNDLFDAKFLKIFFARSDRFENQLDRKNIKTNCIRRLMHQIEQEFNERLPEYELMVKVNLLTILVTMIRNYDYVRDNADFYWVHRHSLSKIEAAMAYIEGHLATDLRLEEVAHIANMSKAYFSTVFKKLNGISPWEHITIKRIELAIKDIQNSDRTVLEIATRCGFNNTANFNRAFRKVTGKTPSSFRNTKR